MHNGSPLPNVQFDTTKQERHSIRLQVIQDWIGKEILSAEKLGLELREEPNTLKKKGLLERTKQQLYLCREKQKLLMKMLDETKAQEGRMWGQQVETEFHMELRQRMKEDIGEQGKMKVDQELDKALNTSQQMIDELLGSEWTLTSIDESAEEPEVNEPPPISMNYSELRL